MNDFDDDAVFDKFARRFRDVETIVKDPPPRHRALAGSGGTGGSGATSVSAGMLGLAAIVVVAALAGPSIIQSTAVSQPTGAEDSSATQPTASSASLDAGIPLDPSFPAGELPGPCQRHVTITDALTTTIEDDARISDSVVVGSVIGLGHGQWNTIGGRVPADRHLTPDVVLRLVRVRVETVIKGAMPDVATFWLAGGVIGCHTFDGGLLPPIDVGSRYVFLLDARNPSNGITALEARRALPVVGDMVVAGDQNLPLEEYVRRSTGVR